MKKYLCILSIMIYCLLVIISTQKPLASFNTNQEVNVRYESCEDGYKLCTYNLTISSSDNKILYNTLQKKAWYISSGLSDFFLSQNYVSPSDSLITVYFDEMWLSISSNGVIRDITNDKYAYISWINNQEKCKAIYEEVYALILNVHQKM